MQCQIPSVRIDVKPGMVEDSLIENCAPVSEIASGMWVLL